MTMSKIFTTFTEQAPKTPFSPPYTGLTDIFIFLNLSNIPYILK